MKRYRVCLSVVLVALTVVWSYPAFCGERELRRELRALVDHEDEIFLLTEIQRIQPFYAIRRLARFQQTQNRVGGGFCGCLPGQLVNAEEIPLPADDIGVLQAAVFLAKQREANRDALARMGYATTFPLMPLAGAPPSDPPPNMAVHMDWSVPAAFLDALSDGEVTMGEAKEIAQLPANREMLRFICARRMDTKPWVTEQTLTYLIWKAGSSDPLDRLWRWVHPVNDFGYAELAVNTTSYRQLIEGLKVHHEDITAAALARVAPFLPADRAIDESFGLTPSCLISDWANPAMSGANMLLIKDGWEELVRRIAAGVFRQQLLKHCSGSDGQAPRTTDDFIHTGLGTESHEVLHELLAYTVVEGTVDYVSNPSILIDETSDVMEGARLIDHYAVGVIKNSPVESARAIFERGRGPGGPLVALGRHMARVIAERDGSQAITDLLEHGFMTFLQRAVEIDSENGGELFSQDLILVIHDLSARLDR